MSNVIIHFGMHKTGSSSIQQSLAKRLDDPRFHYVNLGAANASGHIATAFRHDPAQYHVNLKRARSSEQLQRHRGEVRDKLLADLQLARTRNAIAILSGEGISLLRKPELRDLYKFVMKCQQNVSAVAYIRSPKGFIESSFQQRLKARLRGGESYSDLFVRLCPAYRRRFEKFDIVLGRNQVLFWHFEPDNFPQGCVVQDFCRRLGIDFRPDDVIRVNEGLSTPAVSLLFAYRKFGQGFGVGSRAVKENLLLTKRLGRLRGRKLRFHSTFVGPIIESRRDDIAWMEARIGTSLSENLTRDDEHAIRSEQDLLTFPPEALQWLAQELGPEYVGRCHSCMTGPEVAQWMHALRVKLAGEHDSTKSA